MGLLLNLWMSQEISVSFSGFKIPVISKSVCYFVFQGSEMQIKQTC